MKDLLLGFGLFFSMYSCFQFWLWFINLEKTKQIILKDYIFKERKKKK